MNDKIKELTERVWQLESDLKAVKKSQIFCEEKIKDDTLLPLINDFLKDRDWDKSEFIKREYMEIERIVRQYLMRALEKSQYEYSNRMGQ